MAQMFLNKAMTRAVNEEMARDENVILVGEDVINSGGGLSPFIGVPREFPDRCYDMPIAELGYCNFSNGVAMAGLRPIVDLMFSDFSAIASDAIINGAAKYRFFSQGEISVPIVFVLANGGKAVYGGIGSGACHSQCSEGWFQNVPGLKIVAPYYPADALGLLKASIRDDDPVLFLYPEGSLGRRGQVPEEEYVIPLDHAANVLQEGSDVTIVAIQSMVPVTLDAAAILAEQGISAEVIDPRVLVPLDKDKIIASVNKTGRLVVVHEAPVRGGFAGEICAIVADDCIKNLRGPVKRVGALNSPIPNGNAEEFMMPHKEDIVSAVLETMK